MTLQNAMWRNEANRMAKARDHARMAKNRGEHASAHSIMLSAYITALGGKPVERHHPVKFFLLALWHALCMSRQLEKLNHNQLDVWIQFMLKIRSKLPVFKSILNKVLVEGAAREVGLATTEGKPHQQALAFMTYAEVVYEVEADHGLAEVNIRFAIKLEELIRAESDQPQGLRQFVRILRKAGELYGRDEMSSGGYYTQKAQGYLNRALELAKGEADAQDQVPKIHVSLRKII